MRLPVGADVAPPRQESHWLIVTPARDEAAHLPGLASSLAAQTRGALIGLWVVVDDGSSDGTSQAVEWEALPFPVKVLPRPGRAKGLAHGGAFDAFYAGADHGLELLPNAERVLKLDADVVLEADYLERLVESAGDVALVGGIIRGPGEREQRHHVRGPLKAYSRPAWAVVRQLPPAPGHDVLDEVALRAAGLAVLTVPAAIASVQRRTGVSEGTAEGRRRNGAVSRITGYHPLYFALRVIRYTFRRPAGIGAAAMIVGWVTAAPSPYPPALLDAHRRQQAARLRRLASHPVRYLREAFG